MSTCAGMECKPVDTIAEVSVSVLGGASPFL